MDDLEASQMIEAGLHPTAEQVATNVVAIENNKKGIARIGKISQRTSRTLRPTCSRLILILGKLKRTSKTSKRIRIDLTAWTTTTLMAKQCQFQSGQFHGLERR
jgi:hypothetical protein